MLEDVHSVFNDEFRDSVKAWDSFLEFLAVDHCPPLLQQLDHKFEWFFENESFSKDVIARYNPSILPTEFYDHLGEMYIEKLVTKKDADRRGLFLTPMEVANLMATMTISRTENEVTVLDPCVGTGRFLMAGYKRAPNGMFFGVDIDLRALRVAYTNLAIHGIRGYLLHADSLMHETDIGTVSGRENWQYANKWYSCIDKLKLLSGSDPRNAMPHTLDSNVQDIQQNDLFNSLEQ